MRLSEELARTAILVKEGMMAPPAPRSSMFPGLGVGTNPAAQVSNEAKQRVERNRASAREAAQSPPPQQASAGGGSAIPVSQVPTIPAIAKPGGLPQAKTAAAGIGLSPERLQVLRQEFEDAVEQETLARRHSKWWEEAARARALGEDRTVGGYIGSAAERMLPIPHTGTEALVRLPLVGLGGYFGHRLGSRIEPIPSSEILRAVRPVLEGDRANPPLLRNLEEALRHNPHPAFGVTAGQAMFDRLQQMDPESLSQALRQTSVRTPGWMGERFGNRDIPIWPRPSSPEVQQIRQALGPDIDIVRREIKNVLSQTAEKSLSSRVRPFRIGGTLAGLGAASALTGIPLAVRALLQKSQGGESAVRAKSEAKRLTGQAEEMQKLRERLLKELPRE